MQSWFVRYFFVGFAIVSVAMTALVFWLFYVIDPSNFFINFVSGVLTSILILVLSGLLITLIGFFAHSIWLASRFVVRGIANRLLNRRRSHLDSGLA